MLRAEARGPVTRLVLDRPERRNALDLPTLEALDAGLRAAEADAACRVVLVEGAGDHFCAGRDLRASAAPGPDLASALAWDEVWESVHRGLHRLSKPSVAVVRGHALAGGFTLAMACDLVAASEDARFGASEMRNGFPAAMNTAVLCRLVGGRHALELLLLGEPLPARRLYEMGLINRLAPDARELAGVAEDLAARLAALDPLAVRLAKEAHRSARDMGPDAAITAGKQLNALLTASGQIERGRTAWQARKPAR